MGSRSSTTKFRSGPGYLLDKNGCIIDMTGCPNPCLPVSNQCNPCIPQFSSCSPFSQYTFGNGQPCCEPELINIFSRDDQPPQMNIYNYSYEKPQVCDPFYFNSCNTCFPTFSQRYIQPCFQKQFAQISLNPYQSIYEPSICELPYIQPFIQSFANYMPQRCETPVYPPLAMPAVLPNAQNFLNPFANLCSQNFFMPQPSQVVQQYAPQQPALPPPQFQTIPSYQPTPQFQQNQHYHQSTPQYQAAASFQPTPSFQATPTFQPSHQYQPTPSFQPTPQFQQSVPFQPSPAFQPVSAFPASFQPQSYQQSCPTPYPRPCSLPIAMPYSYQQLSNIPQMPQLSQFQSLPFQNPLLEHFAQLSVRPCNYWL